MPCTQLLAVTLHCIVLFQMKFRVALESERASLHHARNHPVTEDYHNELSLHNRNLSDIEHICIFNLLKASIL